MMQINSIDWYISCSKSIRVMLIPKFKFGSDWSQMLIKFSQIGAVEIGSKCCSKSVRMLFSAHGSAHASVHRSSSLVHNHIIFIILSWLTTRTVWLRPFAFGSRPTVEMRSSAIKSGKSHINLSVFNVGDSVLSVYFRLIHRLSPRLGRWH